MGSFIYLNIKKKNTISILKRKKQKTKNIFFHKKGAICMVIGLQTCFLGVLSLGGILQK